MSRQLGRLRAVEQERDRLAVLLERRLAAVDTAAEAQRDLAAARGQIVDLSHETERLRQQLAKARHERRRLEGLLSRTQTAARGYAEHLDAAERRRIGSSWPRVLATLAGRRDAPDPIHESQPEATT
ncbi:MAG: hypothetical protein OXG79_04655 [Chloroflexi bacterium]|nr:hypothetical protein [Chloroflexota bacterium]MCY4111154.1 hypothetical protein [Chloroflexota bacterium]